MKLKTYLITMGILTVVCWAIWGYILIIVDPNTTNWIGITLFYVSLFLALVGTTAILGFFIRFVALKQAVAFRAVIQAFRQSFLFALLIIISLFLLSKGLFSWLNLLFLIIGLCILEIFMLSYNKNS